MVIGFVWSTEGGYRWFALSNGLKIQRHIGHVYTKPAGAGRAMIKALASIGLEVDEFCGAWHGPRGRKK